MFRSKGKEYPLVLVQAGDCPKIPKRGDDEGNLTADPLEFFPESARVVNVFKRVGAQDSIELVVLEGETVNVLDQDEVRHVCVLHDIRIHAAAIRLAAADIEPPPPAFHNAPLQPYVAGVVDQQERAKAEKANTTDYKHQTN